MTDSGRSGEDAAEREFLDASVAVWREVDRQSAEPDGYRGIDQGTALRQRERAAWEAYRDVLDGRHPGSNRRAD